MMNRRKIAAITSSGGGGGGGGAGIIFQDTFTEASIDRLLATGGAEHVPDIGTGYTEVWDSGSVRLTAYASTDDCYAEATGNSENSIVSADVTYLSANYSAEITIKGLDAGDNYSYLGVRCTGVDPKANISGYVIEMSTSVMALYKNVLGVWTSLGTGTVPAAGSVMKIVADGTSIEVFDDGVSIISVTDSTISATGKCYFGIGAWRVTGSDVINQKFDDLVVTDLG